MMLMVKFTPEEITAIKLLTLRVEAGVMRENLGMAIAQVIGEFCKEDELELYERKLLAEQFLRQQ